MWGHYLPSFKVTQASLQDARAQLSAKSQRSVIGKPCNWSGSVVPVMLPIPGSPKLCHVERNFPFRLVFFRISGYSFAAGVTVNQGVHVIIRDMLRA